MEKVRPWCGQPSDRGRLRNRTEVNTACCLTKNIRNTLKQYHLATAEPLFTVQTIDFMHQTGPRKGAQHPTVCYPHAWCLPSLSQCWSLYEIWELIFISMDWKSMDSKFIAGRSYAINALLMTIFCLSARQCACASCVQHSPTPAVQNSRLPFSWTMAP